MGEIETKIMEIYNNFGIKFLEIITLLPSFKIFIMPASKLHIK